MHKGIYLKALLEVKASGSSSTSPAGATRVTTPDYQGIVKNTIETAAPAWTSKSHLSHQVKRVRLEPGPASAVPTASQGSQVLSVLAYLEGEQDAPQDFAAFTIERWKKLLADVTQQLAKKGIQAKLTTVEEDSDAVDELADDAPGQTTL